MKKINIFIALHMFFGISASAGLCPQFTNITNIDQNKQFCYTADSVYVTLPTALASAADFDQVKHVRCALLSSVLRVENQLDSSGKKGRTAYIGAVSQPIIKGENKRLTALESLPVPDGTATMANETKQILCISNHFISSTGQKNVAYTITCPYTSGQNSVSLGTCSWTARVDQSDSHWFD